MVYMIANCDLPFAIVEQKYFWELLRLLNENAVSLLKSTNQASIATHILRMYNQTQETIKKNILQNKHQSRLPKMRGQPPMSLPSWQ